MNKLCFVLMPFKDALKEVYWQAIKPACAKAGFEALRVDELKGTFNINRKIIEHIFSNDAIVADLSGWNPNVFYELGVAHAIANKTIMIIRKKDRMPFDVSTYRCLQYEQTDAGLVKLREDIVESLLSLETWRQHPTNPVQDFKPAQALLTADERQQWERELRNRRDLITRLETKQQELRQSLAQKETTIAALEKNVANLQTQLAGSRSSPSPLQLRAQARHDLSVDAAQQMIRERNFFDKSKNEQSRGLVHEYETIEREGEKLVMDHATGLTWQQSGSPERLTYDDTEQYIRELNQKNFAGYNDWRLPTLEEAMSLMEPTKKHDELFIDPVFDKKQAWIRTADKESAGLAWVVYFGNGLCNRNDVRSSAFVRAVR